MPDYPSQIDGKFLTVEATDQRRQALNAKIDRISVMPVSETGNQQMEDVHVRGLPSYLLQRGVGIAVIDSDESC